MNITEAKTNVFLEAVTKILTTDNVNTGKTMREIYHYCGDRIYRRRVPQGDTFPQILIALDDEGGVPGLPSNKFLLSITACVKSDAEYSFTTLENMCGRIEYLFAMKPVSINLAVSSKNLRCRWIDKASAISVTDELLKINKKTVIFNVTVDDEILTQ